jgi:hypothetical protein
MFFSGETVRLMKEIVPEYISNNSDFCKLDELERAKDNEEKRKIIQSS